MRPRQHLTFANVCSFLALFLVLTTGGAYAAVRLVDGKTIKPGTVKTKQLGKSSVDSARVRDGSLVANDFKSGTLLTGERGDAGAKGADGVGTKGEAGAAGAAGARGETGAAGPAGSQGQAGAVGSAGAPGAQGPAGAAGAQGPAGPTASSYAFDEVAISGLGTTTVTALALTDPPPATSTGRIVMPFAGRIHVGGSVTVANTSTSAPVRVACSIAVESTTGADIGEGVEHFTDILPASASLGAHFTTVPVDAVAVRPAGSYDVKLRCRRAFGTVTYELSNPTLSVTGVAT